MKEKPRSLEDYIAEVEETVSAMEEGDLPLEEAFRLYEDGVKKLRLAEEAIGSVERKMAVLKGEED